MIIQNGATVQYQGAWFGNGSASGDSLVGAVIADLARVGLSVIASANNGGMSPDSVSTFGVSMTVKINNGTGFASEDDILTLIHHWVGVEAGKLPDLDAIPTVSNPQPSVDNSGKTVPGGIDTATGQRSVPGAPGTTTTSGTPGLLPQWLKDLLNKLKNLLQFPNLNLWPVLIVVLGLGLVISVIMIAAPKPRTIP